jgi:hypothetical protein
MKKCGGIAPPFLTLALDASEWSASRPCRFTLGETVPCAYCIGRQVGSRAGMDFMKKRKSLVSIVNSTHPPSSPASSLVAIQTMIYPDPIYTTVLLLISVVTQGRKFHKYKIYCSAE